MYLIILSKLVKLLNTDVFKGKTYNMVKLLLTDVIGQGKLVAIDSGFPMLYLLRDAMQIQTSFKCNKCSSVVEPFSLCSRSCARDI